MNVPNATKQIFLFKKCDVLWLMIIILQLVIQEPHFFTWSFVSLECAKIILKSIQNLWDQLSVKDFQMRNVKYCGLKKAFLLSP